MNDYNYDYTIVGGGPSGITLAYTLSSIGKKCCLIDLNVNLGGCHRVTRSTEGLFTEHGPRIYSNSYVNTINLLKDMNLNFYDIFTPYNFTISNIQGESFKNFTLIELVKLSKEFLKIFFGLDKYSRNISVEKFMSNNGFTQKSLDYADRLCRLTDGAGSDRYSLYNFLQLVNQQYFYILYQPRKPNDTGLFKLIQNRLELNNVDIFLQTKVLSINNLLNKVESIDCLNTQNNTFLNIKSKNFIFCIPPKSYLDLIKQNTEIYSSYNNIDQFVINNTYINDIPIVFHWKSKLDLPKKWGFPSTEWGIAYVILSDYMDFEDPRSQTVISTCITKLNVKSSFMDKTPDECNEIELKNEVFRQLKISYPEIQNYDYAIIHPSVKRINDKWIETDTAYVTTYHNEYLKSNNQFYENLYFVGTHNGNSSYDFTSFESAVENALTFSHYIEPSTSSLKIKNRVTVIYILRIIFIIMILLVILYMINKRRQN
jgi:hypothetical protein